MFARGSHNITLFNSFNKFNTELTFIQYSLFIKIEKKESLQRANPKNSVMQWNTKCKCSEDSFGMGRLFDCVPFGVGCHVPCFCFRFGVTWYMCWWILFYYCSCVTDVELIFSFLHQNLDFCFFLCFRFTSYA
jgi:hypothetical protein